MDNTTWEWKLKQIKECPPVALEQGKIGLLKYELIDYINNDAKVKSVKSILKSDHHMIPYCENNYSKISAISKTKSMSISSSLQEYDFSRGDKYIDSCITKGMHLVELTWDNNGDITKTFCVVSGENDIVYDNFITNTIVVKKSIKTTYVNSNGITKQTGESLGRGFHGFVKWHNVVTAEWLFGGERGEAGVFHTGNYAYGGFTYHTYNAFHYMSVGNSNAKVIDFGGSGSISYAAGLSTPTVSVNISANSGLCTIDFGFGLGSSAGISGVHNFPNNSEFFFE